jgi:predicted amidohydrolase
MSDGGQGEALVTALKRAGEDPIPALALLWTWLDERLPDLAERRMKAPEIVEDIAERMEDRPFEGYTPATWRAFEEDSVLGAAELLASINHSIDPARPLIGEARSFRGEKVLVCLRESLLVAAASGEESPPSEREHPSLTTLAPQIVVSPVELHGVSLEWRQANGPLWDGVVDPLLEQLIEKKKPRIEVHLETLGSHGLTGWDQPNGRRGHFDKIEEKDRRALVAEARAAVGRASRPGVATVLMFPELGVDKTALAAIQGELRKREDSGRPCLTVVGLRHLPIDDGDPKRAQWANEAVVLAPNGAELWRHRKITYAGSKKSTDEYKAFVEDIRTGRALRLFQTPVGNLAVVICLDSFGDAGRDRLAKSPANVILVPSLSKSATPHRTSLAQLVNSLYAIAFVCNRSPYAREEGPDHWNGHEARSFWALVLRGFIVPRPRRDPAKDPPSFVFRMSTANSSVIARVRRLSSRL